MNVIVNWSSYSMAVLTSWLMSDFALSKYKLSLWICWQLQDELRMSARPREEFCLRKMSSSITRLMIVSVIIILIIVSFTGITIGCVKCSRQHFDANNLL